MYSTNPNIRKDSIRCCSTTSATSGTYQHLRRYLLFQILNTEYGRNQAHTCMEFLCFIVYPFSTPMFFDVPSVRFSSYFASYLFYFFPTELRILKAIALVDVFLCTGGALSLLIFALLFRPHIRRVFEPLLVQSILKFPIYITYHVESYFFKKTISYDTWLVKRWDSRLVVSPPVLY